MVIGQRYPHLANLITLSRIIGVGFILWLTPFSNNYEQLTVIIIYAFVCLTDFLDGYIARKLKIVTDLGKVLDPLADKILILVFLPLLQMQAIKSFPVFLILSREFIVMGIRVFSAKQGDILPAGISGKIKTAITLPICGLLLARVSVPLITVPVYLQPLEWCRVWVSQWPAWVFDSLIAAMVGITLWSLVTYIKDFMWTYFLARAKHNPELAKRRLRLWIPNSVTLLNLSFGVMACFYAWYGVFQLAVLLILLGTLLDGLDGKLARRLNAFSKFGAKLDSKADFVNFGIAPAVVLFRILSEVNLAWGILIGLVYYAAVHYRLRRFDQSGHSHYFDGLPSPVGAGIVVLGAISASLSLLIPLSILVVITATLMVSKIPYPHLDIANRETFLRFLRIPILVFLVLTLLHLLDIHIARDVYAYEILLALTGIYVMYPIFERIKKKG